MNKDIELAVYICGGVAATARRMGISRAHFYKAAGSAKRPIAAAAAVAIERAAVEAVHDCPSAAARAESIGAMPAVERIAPKIEWLRTPDGRIYQLVGRGGASRELHTPRQTTPVPHMPAPQHQSALT